MGNPQDIDRGLPAAAEGAASGQRLRLAREARKLTCDAIAAQLRIEPKIIEALERDDYAQLPSAVFVRGYLKAYAKLVGLPAEPLLGAYDQRVGQSPTRLVLPAAVGPDMESRGGYARWIVFALALLSLLLFYQWWSVEGGAPTTVEVAPPAPQMPATTSETESGADKEIDSPAMEAGVPLENIYVLPSDESGLDTATATIPLAIAPALEPVPAAVVPAPAAAQQAAAAVVVDDSGPAPAVQAETESQAPVTSAAATGQLVLRFTDDCWVVVRDASGKALLHGLIKSGDWHALSGKPPFDVTLGNSPGVQIEYMGERFDQSRYTGASRVAHFTLGQ